MDNNYGNNVVNTYVSVGHSYGGIEGLSNNNNTSSDGDYLKQSSCKRQKIDIKPNVVGYQFEQQVEPQYHQIASTSAVEDTVGTSNTSSVLVLNDDNLKKSSFPNRNPEKPLRGILKAANAYNKLEDGLRNVKKADLLYNRKRGDRYTILTDLLECKLAKGSPLSPHVEKMIGLVERLQKLDSDISQELAIDIILRSLPDEYIDFITVFLKCDLQKTVYELHDMLKTAKIHLRRRNHTNALLVPKKEGTKKQAKKKVKGKKNVQIKNLKKSKPKPKPKRGSKSEDMCNYCNEFGHWKRNCKKYLESLKK